MKRITQFPKILSVLILFSTISIFFYACTKSVDIKDQDVLTPTNLIQTQEKLKQQDYLNFTKAESDLINKLLKDQDFLAWINAKSSQKNAVMEKIRQKSSEELKSLLNDLANNKTGNASKNLESFYLKFMNKDELINFTAEKLFYQNKFQKKYTKEEGKMMRKNVLVYVAKTLYLQKMSHGRTEECYEAPAACHCIEICEFAHMECDWGAEAEAIYMGMAGEEPSVIQTIYSGALYQCWLSDVQCSTSCL